MTYLPLGWEIHDDWFSRQEQLGDGNWLLVFWPRPGGYAVTGDSYKTWINVLPYKWVPGGKVPDYAKKPLLENMLEDCGLLELEAICHELRAKHSNKERTHDED